MLRLKYIILILALIALGIFLVKSKNEQYKFLGRTYIASDSGQCEFNADCRRGPASTHCTMSSGQAGICTLNDRCCPTFEIDRRMDDYNLTHRNEKCPEPMTKLNCASFCACRNAWYDVTGVEMESPLLPVNRYNGGETDCMSQCLNSFHPYPDIIIQ